MGQAREFECAACVFGGIHTENGAVEAVGDSFPLFQAEPLTHLEAEVSSSL